MNQPLPLPQIPQIPPETYTKFLQAIYAATKSSTDKRFNAALAPKAKIPCPFCGEIKTNSFMYHHIRTHHMEGVHHKSEKKQQQREKKEKPKSVEASPEESEELLALGIFPVMHCRFCGKGPFESEKLHKDHESRYCLKLEG